MTHYSLKYRIIFTLIPLSVLLIATLTLAEIYIRLFSPYGYVTPEILRARSPQYDPASFARFVLQPREQKIKRQEKVVLYINEKGYRGRNFSVAKPDGFLRIMVYGGSTVFDSALPEEKDWPHRVEALLREKGVRNVEVINAGIPGHTSAESVTRLFTEGHLFNPDIVILYDTWNDIKHFRSNKPLLRELQPYFFRHSDPRVNYRNVFDRLLCEHSQLYVRLRERYYAWRLRIGAEGRIPTGAYSSKLSEVALIQYRLTVSTFVDLARNINAVPILMTEARLVALNNDASQKRRIAYERVLLTHEILSEAFEKADEIIYSVAKAKDAHLIDASKYLTGRDELFIDHVHLSPVGSEELAKRVASELRQILENHSPKHKLSV